MYYVLMKSLMDKVGMKRQIVENVLEERPEKREGLNEYLCVGGWGGRRKNVGAYNQKGLKTRGDQAGDKEI